MLRVKDLKASVDGKQILKGLNLEVNPGEVHAIMGLNGSGKSTLAQVIAGNPQYTYDSGDLQYKGKDLTELSAHERSREGIFLGFQYPVEIPGVSNIYFLKNALNAILEHQGKPAMDAIDFKKYLKSKMDIVGMNNDLLKRSVNQGFSGGEKKRNEILQLLVLNPSLAILDETDSGLDIDALRVVSEGVQHFRNENNAVILVTHYQRMLDYVKPDFVHVLINGEIVKSGGKELALELEEKGYDWLQPESTIGG